MQPGLEFEIAPPVLSGLELLYHRYQQTLRNLKAVSARSRHSSLDNLSSATGSLRVGSPDDRHYVGRPDYQQRGTQGYSATRRCAVPKLAKSDNTRYRHAET